MAARPLRFVLAGLAAAGLGASALGAADGPVEGRISIESRDGSVVVEGMAVAADAGTYDVALHIVKDGEAGSASTRQGSALTLAAGEMRSVGRMSFNLLPGDALTVTIEISRDGELLSRASSDLRY